jgi:hypothetical protein
MNNIKPNDFQSISMTGKVRIPAQRTIRNGHPTFIAAIPFKLLFEIIERIEPDTALAANRKVESKRLPEIGQYFIKEKDHWIFPPILVDTQDELEFEPFAGQQFSSSNVNPVSGVPAYRIEGGMLVVDNGRKILKIMDGQHRFMGNLLQYEEIEKELSRAKATRLDFKNQGDKLSEDLLSAKIKTLQENYDRYSNETLTVEIVTLVTDSLHKRWFTTVADKAEGINYSARTRLDEVSTTSIAANVLANSYPLFLGKDKKTNVEEHQMLAKKSGKEIYSLGNIRDWTKNIAFGTTDKATLKRESDLNENNLVETTQIFLGILEDKCRIFKDLSNHRITGKEFRQKSLLSSPTIIRALTGAFHELCITKVDNNQGEIKLEINSENMVKFGKMVSQLDKFCDYIITGKKLDVHPNWRKIGSTSTATSGDKDTVFRSSGIAPQSGFQERQVLSDLFVKWTETGNVFDPITVPKRKKSK